MIDLPDETLVLPVHFSDRQTEPHTVIFEDQPVMNGMYDLFIYERDIETRRFGRMRFRVSSDLARCREKP
jgi:hypothetical protein